MRYLLAIALVTTGCMLEDPTELEQTDQSLTGSNGTYIPPIDFSVSADPTSIGVIAGQGGSFDLVVVGSSTGGCITVSITASMPSGVSMVYGYASTSSFQLCAQSTVRTQIWLDTTWATPAATYPITFTAAGGSHIHSATVSLAVEAQHFAPAVWPPAVNLDAGKTASAWVSMTGNLDYDNPLYVDTFQMSAQGLPTGVTATFSPPSISYQYPYEGSTVTFTAAPGVVVPPTAVTLVATAAGKSGTTTIQLGPQSQLITNGGFESGTTGWQLGGQVSRYSSLPTYGCGDPHLGSAWLAGSGTASVAQTFAIPANATSASLGFWIYGNTSSSAPLVVDVHDWNTGTRIPLASYSALSLGFCSTGFIYTPYAYERHDFDLTRFRGHLIRLELQIAPGADGTIGSFALDDVSVAATY
jgi:hypothetical protein